MKEKWRDVVGFEGRYEVSDLGKIKRHETQRVLSPALTTKGYLTVTLYPAGGGKQNALVHRLVGAAFIPNPNALPQINHIDCDKTNNALRNLEWINDRENQRHAAQNSLKAHGSANGNSKLKEKDIPLIRILLAKGFTQTRIAEQFGVHPSLIGDISRGQIWRRA